MVNWLYVLIEMLFNWNVRVLFVEELMGREELSNFSLFG